MAGGQPKLFESLEASHSQGSPLSILQSPAFYTFEKFNFEMQWSCNTSSIGACSLASMAYIANLTLLVQPGRKRARLYIILLYRPWLGETVKPVELYTLQEHDQAVYSAVLDQTQKGGEKHSVKLELTFPAAAAAEAAAAASTSSTFSSMTIG